MMINCFHKDKVFKNYVFALPPAISSSPLHFFFFQIPTYDFSCFLLLNIVPLHICPSLLQFYVRLDFFFPVYVLQKIQSLHNILSQLTWFRERKNWCYRFFVISRLRLLGCLPFLMGLWMRKISIRAGLDLVTRVFFAHHRPSNEVDCSF